MKALRLAFILGIALIHYVYGNEARFFRIAGPETVTFTSCGADGMVTWVSTTTNAIFTVQTLRSLSGINDWADYVQVPVTNSRTTHRLFDPNPPAQMEFIPAGTFQMGDLPNDFAYGDTPWNEYPVHEVFVGAFYMDKFEVTKALWDDVYRWGMTNGYNFDFSGSGKDFNHPVNTLNWYDMVKWCNARSEKEGLTPAYYTDSRQTNVYRKGLLDLLNDSVKWNSGYRLPTEAEWEKAARGGGINHRYPWFDVDTITHSQANYNSTNRFAYDISPTRGFHPPFITGDEPGTFPVGSFAANGYGLYDMAGNVAERCWDWFDQSYYSSSPNVDPQGSIAPVAYRLRTIRGGGWSAWAYSVRCSYRGNSSANVGSATTGFRCVRGALVFSITGQASLAK